MWRLFVALYPPREIAQACLDKLKPLSLPDYRATPISQIHVTVHFIVDRRERDIDAVIESVQRAKRGLSIFSLRPEVLITLPEHGPPPRMVAVEMNAPGDLLEYHSRLVRRFSKASRQQPSRGYKPHMTLCRFRPSAKRVDRIVLPVNDIPEFPVDKVVLMRSHLKPTGVVHEMVAPVLMPVQ